MLNTDRLCPVCMNDNGGEANCPICGSSASVKNKADELPVRFWLCDRYLIGKAVLCDSEGITYSAWDNSTDSAVTVREYFPKDAASRNPDKTVSIVIGKEFAFNEGLMEFMEVNKRFISTELSAVVPVLSVFEENGTVYAVRPAIAGISLCQFLSKNGGSLKWEQARPLFLPLIDTVKELSESGFIHGGISPESILVGRDGKLRLTDICVSGVRKTDGELNAKLYEGYAAAEQYGIEGLTVGAYTDVYGISATLFRVLIGTAPACAKDRLENDGLSIPSRFADELPRQVLVALANGLQVNPENRTANMDVFRNELVYGETQENVRKAAARKAQQEKAVSAAAAPQKEKKPVSGFKYAAISAGCTALAFILIAVILCLTVFRGAIFGNGKDIVSTPDSTYDAPEPSSQESVIVPTESKKLYSVPDFSGKTYAEIIKDKDNEIFDISIKNKDYSTKYARGTVCAQSVKAGSNVEKETKIELTISLGTQEVKIANIVGLDKNSAIIELLKQGFLYENFDFVDQYDETAEPGKVLKQEPTFGSTANVDQKVEIYINSYEGEPEENYDYYDENFDEN